MQLQLLSAGPHKIPVIKVVREYTRWGLKQAKEWVDSAPAAALEVASEQADGLALALRDAGATVQVSGGGATTATAADAPAAPAVSKGIADELEELAALRDRGILTDDEFAAAKARLLGIS